MANSYGTIGALNANSLLSLASGQYLILGDIALGASPPDEVFVEVVTKPSNTTSGNKQLVLFVLSSLDGTTWSDMPSATTELNVRRLAALALPDGTQRRTPAIPVSPLFGGALPPYLRIVAKNDAGVALSSTQSDHGARWMSETLG